MVLSDSDTVSVRTTGRVGELTLNRPRAINALSIDMIRTLACALQTWAHDGSVSAVILDGAGERGLCAGGDVRGLRERVLTGDVETARTFFREEYALNAQLAEYPVPVAVFADGITMGGGIGLAGHASARFVTERSTLAMPETRIGFAPDVGGTWLLAHAPGRLGEYLALTGTAMSGADAVYAGLADYLVASDALPRIRERILDGESPDQVGESLAAAAAVTDDAPLAASRAWVDDAFAAESVPEIMDRLRASSEPEAHAAADTLTELSPTSLVVTLAAVRSARDLPDLRATLAQEFALACWFIDQRADLLEGIRAQLVDKDRAPRWQPPTLADLPEDLGATALAFRPDVPLWS